MSLEAVIHKTKKSVAKSTAVMSVVTPIAAALETHVAHMTNYISANSRVNSVLFTLALLPVVDKVWEKISRKHELDKSSKLKSNALEILYYGAWASTIRPTIYLLSGETDPEKIVYGTLFVTGAAMALSFPLKYGAEIYQNLLGLNQYENIPKRLENKTSKFKKNLAISVVVASLALTGAVYAFNKDKTLELEPTINNIQYISQVVTNKN